MMRRIFFFMSYTFSPHVAAHEISNFPPFFTLRVESGLSSVYTRSEEKFEEAKRVAGPIIPAVYGFLLPSPLIHHCPPPRNSSISPEIWLFFLHNAPFREPILRSLSSLQSSFARTFPLIPVFCLLRFCFLCWGRAGNILSDCGEWYSNLTPYIFLYWKS